MTSSRYRQRRRKNNLFSRRQKIDSKLSLDLGHQPPRPAALALRLFARAHRQSRRYLSLGPSCRIATVCCRSPRSCWAGRWKRRLPLTRVTRSAKSLMDGGAQVSSLGGTDSPTEETAHQRVEYRARLWPTSDAQGPAAILRCRDAASAATGRRRESTQLVCGSKLRRRLSLKL